MGLTHTDVGETDYKYWSHSLSDFTDDQIMAGLKKAESFDGYLTLGAFRDLCTPEVRAPYHKPFQALPKPKMTPAQRKEKMKDVWAVLGVEK